MTTAPGDLYVAWLSDLDDHQLAELLRRRPDTVLPLPPGPGPLAARLQLRASVARALRQLTALDLAVMEVAADLGAEVSGVAETDLVAEVTRRAGVRGVELDGRAVAAARRRLEDFGLLFPARGRLRLVAEAMTALPAAFSVLPPRSDEDIAAAVDKLGEPQRRALNSLAVSGGVGHSRDAAVDADPSRPIPALINAGLLERIDSSHVRLPRSVARVIRGAHAHSFPLAAPERGDGPVGDADVARIDAAGAAQGLEFTRRIAALVDVLSHEPIALNKDRSVPARAAAALAKTLSTQVEEVALLVSVAAASGLVTTGLAAGVPEPLDPEANYLAPAREVDEWLSAELPQRFSRIVAGWLSNPYAHFRQGRLLDEGLRVDKLPHLRSVVMEQYARLPAGAALPADDVAGQVAFHAPLVSVQLVGDELPAFIAEAAAVGVVARDAATTVLRDVLGGRDVGEAVAAHTPGEVEQFIVQADMTVMVPGPMPHRMQAMLDQIADVEAPGLAAVYRLSQDSVSRGLDAGVGGAEMLGWLEEHCIGELPQTVTYLVNDTARRHGGLRGGAAASYLRCPDEAEVARMMASPAAAEAGLVQVAPTVVVSAVPLARVVHILRRHGFRPVAEDAAGETVDITPDPVRVYASPARASLPVRSVDQSRIDAAVHAVRGRSPAAAPGSDASEADPAGEATSVAATLQAAARGGLPVTIRAVDKSGRPLTLVVTPLTVSGGQVDALEPQTGRVQRILLHRITSASIN